MSLSLCTRQPRHTDMCFPSQRHQFCRLVLRLNGECLVSASVGTLPGTSLDWKFRSRSDRRRRVGGWVCPRSSAFEVRLGASVPKATPRKSEIIGGDNSMTAGYRWRLVTSVHAKSTPLLRLSQTRLRSDRATSRHRPRPHNVLLYPSPTSYCRSGIRENAIDTRTHIVHDRFQIVQTRPLWSNPFIDL